MRKVLMPVKKARKKKAAKAKKSSKKSGAARKKASRGKPNARSKPAASVRSSASRPLRQTRGRNQEVETVTLEPKDLGARSGGQSGGLQGLSNRRRASSESVDELLEEGNAFEAEIVKGVEEAGDADEHEVRTHEVPQDDVPEEYQDQERERDR
jgi:hypothetical protein